MDPHSTSSGARQCLDCHANPKTLGLGYGSFYQEGANSWGFEPSCWVNKDLFGQKRRLDAFVDTEGNPLVHLGRPGLRPFNKRELGRIVKVGFCLPCHKNMEDPVMKSWKKDTQPTPCTAYRKLTGMED